MLSRFLALPLVVRETLLWHTAKRQLLETSYEYETCPVLSAPGVAQISAEARCVEGARETLLDSAAQHTVPIFSMLGTKRTVSAGFLEAVLWSNEDSLLVRNQRCRFGFHNSAFGVLWSLFAWGILSHSYLMPDCESEPHSVNGWFIFFFIFLLLHHQRSAITKHCICFVWI